MKKITLLAVVALAVTFTACKKDRTCECTQTDTNSNGTTSVTTTDPVMTIEVKKVSKGDAKYMCQKMESSYTYSTTTNSTINDCKLK